MYIFDEQEEIYISHDNVMQTRPQANQFKTKEIKEKEKMKPNGLEPTKQQPVASQAKNPPQMMYNVIYDLTKLRINLSFLEVVKIPRQRENILEILDEPSNRIEAIVENPNQHHNISEVKPRGKVPHFYITI
jgi:hypothetical protein